MKKFLLGAPIATAAAALSSGSDAKAQVVVFDINDFAVNTSSSTKYIGNLSPSWSPSVQNAYSGNSVAGQSIGFDFYAGWFSTEKPRLLLSAGQSGLTPAVAGFNSGGYFFATKFSLGATIDSSSGWQANTVYLENGGTGAWNGSTGDTAYAGLRVQDAGGGNNYYYGWIEIAYDDSANSYSVSRFALNSTLNASITAGQTAVPEPATSAMLLAAGAAGVALYRRRKAAAKAEAA